MNIDLTKGVISLYVIICISILIGAWAVNAGEPNMSYEQQLFERKLEEALKRGQVSPAKIKKFNGAPIVIVPSELLGDSLSWTESFIVVGADYQQARFYNIKTGKADFIYDLRGKKK